MSDSEFHQKELLRHCRVCACVMEDRNGPRFGYRCEEEHNQSLLLKLGIDVKGDQPDVHPMHFCHLPYEGQPAFRDYRQFSCSIRLETTLHAPQL